jgi:peroxiredoxin/GNAT superfamily N-acetyltransferase
MNAHDPTQLPPGLPVPQDDGECDHLGRPPFDRLPESVRLPLTDGGTADLASLSTSLLSAAVFFFYPRTGVPGQAPNRGRAGEEWDEIPGARGCTPQSCGFRDLHGEFAALGVQVFGVSTNTTEHQREFKARQHVPYEFVSDSDLELVRALRLPTFEFPVESGGPSTLIRRMAIFAVEGRIVKVWYPVFPPDQNAATVLEYVRKWRAAKDRPGAAGQGLSIRPIEPRDFTWVREELKRNWGATQISSRGKWFDADRLPGFIAERGVTRIGLVTHTPPERGEECEVVTLSSREQGRGAGELLLRACEAVARNAGCSRVFLTTTNDNLHALGFYQRRGWRLVAVHRGAMDKARAVKPEIPIMGQSGIPLHDEIELERRFS